MQSKIIKKVLSGILSVSLMFQIGMPVVYAEESNPKQETKTITAFANLAENVKNITVPTGTAKDKLPLPETITATVEGTSYDEVTTGSAITDGTRRKNNNVELAVTWESDKPFSSEKADNFAYTAKLTDESYILGVGVEMPKITVTVVVGNPVASMMIGNKTSKFQNAETVNNLKITSADGSFETSQDNGGLIKITSSGSYTLSMDGAASSTTGILIEAPNGTVNLILDGITVETANECLKAKDTNPKDDKLKVVVDLNGKASSLTYTGSDLEKYFGSKAMNMEVTDSKDKGSLVINGGLFADARSAPYGNIQFKKGTITIDPKGNTIGIKGIPSKFGPVSIDGADVIIPKEVDSHGGKVFSSTNVKITAGSFTWEGAEVGNLDTTRGVMMLSLNGGTATVGKLSSQFHQINNGVLNGDVADPGIKIKGGRINGSVTGYTKIQLPYQEGEKISIENNFWDYNGKLTTQEWNATDSEKMDGKITLWIRNDYDQKITIGSTAYEYKWDSATSSFCSTTGATVRLISDLSYSASMPKGDDNPPKFSITAEKTELAQSTDKITYQWYENKQEILSATEASYTMPIGKEVGAYTYYCKVTCGTYSMHSGIATVNVVDAVAGVVINGNNSYYDNLEAAFGAVPKGEKSTITLLKNIDLGNSSVPNHIMKGDITLNLNGKTLSSSGNNGVIAPHGSQSYPFTITGAGTINYSGSNTLGGAIKYFSAGGSHTGLTIEDNVQIVTDRSRVVYLGGGADLHIKGNAKLITSNGSTVIYAQGSGSNIIIDGGNLQNNNIKKIIHYYNCNNSESVVINKPGAIMREGSIEAPNIYFNVANDGVSTTGNTWYRINTDAIQSAVSSNKMEFTAGDNTTKNDNLLYGKKDEIVSFTSTAKAGYVISDIAAVTKGSTALKVTNTQEDYTSAQNTCTFSFTMPSDDGVAVSVPVKLENCFKLVGENISRAYDGNAFEVPTTKGKHFTWSGTGAANIEGYYTDNTCSTQTNEANSGATTNGGAPKNVGTYYAKVRVLADDDYASTIGYVPFTITQSGTTFDGGIKTYKDNAETNTFNYGDTITVKVTPKATGKKPITNGLKMARSFSAPTLNQMALFMGKTQITESQQVISGQELTFTYDTKGASSITPNTPVKITAKYVGNNNMADYEQDIEVTVNAVTEVTKGSTVSYAGTLQGAFDLIGSGETGTIKILKDIDLGENGVNQTGGSTVTFDLNGCTVKHSKNDSSAITIYSSDITKLTVKSSIDGGTLLESGRNSKAINNAIGKGEVIIESGLIRSTGSVGGKAIYNANKLTINGGILDTLKNGYSIMNAENAATLEVNGGIVKSVSEAIFNKYGTVSINGGTVLGKVAIDNGASGTVNYAKGIILGDCTGDGTYTEGNPQWLAKGTATLLIDAEIPSSKTFTVTKDTNFTIKEGTTLTNNGNLVLNGKLNGTGTISGTGEFKITLFMADDIQDIPDKTYTGSMIKPVISINGKTIMGKEFTIDTSSYTGPTYQKQSSTEAWDNVDNDSILNVGTYRAVYTKTSDNSIITKEFSVTQGNGRITIKNDYKVSYTYTSNIIAEPEENQIDKLGDGKVTLEWYNGKNEDETVTGLTKRDSAPVEVGTYTLKAIVGESTNYNTAYTTVLVTIKSEQLETVSIIVDEGTSYTINGSEYTAPNTNNYSLGTNVTVAVSDEKDFAYWVNDYGNIVSRKVSYTFTVTGSMKLTAVYNKKVENKSTVIFESYYGQVISRMQLGSVDMVTFPAGPTRYGYNFTRWSMTVDEIKKQITDGVSVIKVTPVYELINQSYTITVKHGTGSRSYKLNDLVTATANDPEVEKKFSNWTDGDGNILSYNTTYQFYAIKNVEITANYVVDTKVVEAKGTAEIIDINKDTEKSKIIFVSMVTVPEGCKIQMAGVIGTNDPKVGTSGEEFNKDTAAYVRGGAWSSNACRYTWTKKVKAEETWYVRAYLVYKDTNGNLITVYGDMVSAGLNN